MAQFSMEIMRLTGSLLRGNQHRPQFWTEAFIRGGGGGMMGDFVNSSVSRGGAGVTEFLGGPGPSAIISTADFLKNGFNGKSLAQYMKGWTPGSSLWYTKLATDRMVFDQIQAMIDPDYRKSFRRYEKRMKKDFGQTFWWSPGQTAPARSPAFQR